MMTEATGEIGAQDFYGAIGEIPLGNPKIIFNGNDGLIAEIDTVTGEVKFGEMYTSESAGLEAAKMFWKHFGRGGVCNLREEKAA